MRAQFQLALAACLIIAAADAQAAPITLTVGPNGQFTRLGDAVASETAGNTYDILIAAGTYLNDFSTVTQPTSITATGGTVTLLAKIPPTDLKGIITTTTSLSVERTHLPGCGDLRGGRRQRRRHPRPERRRDQAARREQRLYRQSKRHPHRRQRQPGNRRDHQLLVPRQRQRQRLYPCPLRRGCAEPAGQRLDLLRYERRSRHQEPRAQHHRAG
jgi:hypothetical protein